MPRKVAAAASLLVFALCVVYGGFAAGNTLETTLARAMWAMAGAGAVAFVLALMAERMLRENVEREERRLLDEAALGTSSESSLEAAGGAGDKKSQAKGRKNPNVPSETGAGDR